MKKRDKFILKLIVSAVLLVVLFHKVDKGVVLKALYSLDLRYLPLIFLLLVLNYVVSSFRWKSLLIFKGSEDVSVMYLMYLYFVGSFFNNFAPSSVGGDVYKVLALGKKINSKTHAFSATFMERFTGVVVLGFISALGMTRVLGPLVIALIVWLVLGLYVGVALLKYLATKIRFLKKIHDSLMTYSGRYRVLVWALVTSLAVQLISIFTQYFIFMAMGIHLPLLYSLFVFPIIALASFLPISLNGVGIQDSLYALFFKFVGVPITVSLGASIAYHLSRLSVSLIGGVWYAIHKD